MDLVVRSALANREDVKKFKEETQTQYEEIMAPSTLTELTSLESQLSDTLKTFVPESGVSLEWQMGGEIDIPLPKADVKLVEDDYIASVDRTGHGLQRAFILTMLQHLAIARVPPESDETLGEEADVSEKSEDILRQPNLILGIEEPELYQHPNRQRHMSRVLYDLATGAIPGVVDKTQVIYSTHSPLFIGIDRYDQVRILHKTTKIEGDPKITQIDFTTLDQIANTLWDASDKSGEKFTGETLSVRLQTIMTPWMNEGFFSRLVVLVEGEDDRSAILGVSKIMGYDFESIGISVIPCMGKNNLDRPFVIFEKLKIPVYVIWDSDYGKDDAKPEDNRYLLKLLGETEEDWPEKIEDSFSCFKENLNETLYEEIGKELFNTLLSNVQDKLGIRKKRRALKNPMVISQVLGMAEKEGKSSETLKTMVEKIVTKNNSS